MCTCEFIIISILYASVSLIQCPKPNTCTCFVLCSPNLCCIFLGLTSRLWYPTLCSSIDNAIFFLAISLYFHLEQHTQVYRSIYMLLGLNTVNSSLLFFCMITQTMVGKNRQDSRHHENENFRYKCCCVL